MLRELDAAPFAPCHPEGSRLRSPKADNAARNGGESTMTSKQSERGFTMAELLVVVAIIAVLVAIAIPVFGAQLEKSRQAVDLANVRSAYAALQISKIEGTNPDGSTTGGFSSFGTYVYTGSGFEKFNPDVSSAQKEAAIKLVSNGNPVFLRGVVQSPEDLFFGNSIPESINGYVIIAWRPETFPEAALMLIPNPWL